MSCNGCRVLRRGCVEGCILRSCLQWINEPESQANATLFLAKFYGRAGLMNLINAGPPDLHPEIFRSLLYEACGRIINPVHGAVGLMSSGNWRFIEAAVEAVLRGAPLMMVPQQGQITFVPFRGCDIRRLTKYTVPPLVDLVRRSVAQERDQINPPGGGVDLFNLPEARFTLMGWNNSGAGYPNIGELGLMRRAPSQESFSVQTVEQAVANQGGYPVPGGGMNPGPSRMGLDLTLGLKTVVDIPEDSGN